MENLLNFEKYFESKENKDLEVFDYDLPDEVKKTTIAILKDLFDKVKDPYFHSTQDGLNLIEFVVTDNDFRFVDPEEDLEMEMTPGVKKKRLYEVTLKFHDKIDETKTLVYEIFWGDMPELKDEIVQDDELDNLPDDDEWYKDEEENDDVEKVFSKDFVNKETRIFQDDEYYSEEDEEDEL